MAIVKGLSNQYRAADNKLLDPMLTDAQERTKAIRVSNLATDNTGSTYKLCGLPSDCLLDPGTAFYVQDWGFADIRIGTLTDPAALISQLKSAGNTVNPVTAGNATHHGQRLWQRLGLAADPGGVIDLYAHAIANATGAGELRADVRYRFRG